MEVEKLVTYRGKKRVHYITQSCLKHVKNKEVDFWDNIRDQMVD